VHLAVERCGGLAPTAELLGVRYQAVQKWLRRELVPAKRVLLLAAASGVPKELIRPDLYPTDSSVAGDSPIDRPSTVANFK